MLSNATEIEAITKRYERRCTQAFTDRYSPLDPYVMMADQEKDRAIIRQLKRAGISQRIAECTLLEMGCGYGSNLVRFIQLGVRPENIVGNDLLPGRLREAREKLPPSVRLMHGDASQLVDRDGSYDIVALFTVLSSILDDDVQQRLAAKAWSLAKPGGGVLCYDFIYNNPTNSDVRGVPMRRLRNLFPEAAVRYQRLTLAPPLGRPLARVFPALYAIVNSAWLLRTHVLAWLLKPAERKP